MIGFEIWLNEKYICTAGIQQNGSLSAITHWVKRTDSTSDEELYLDVGGLSDDLEANHVYLKWVNRQLTIGDEINIKIVQVPEVNKPISEKRELAGFIEEEERRCYERLKQKYEN
ncbi:hypothetical protein NIES267_52300 [Calothrix parasitica NIES-267]|uniref:Uncharacterized protein n=1 Tax=Calothrix parasitica NIES-267 TaxID=1973488 RepID=A0A1Z4LWX7_9CYAN|nr:hypothetical protein NIES267_52300 [Calothrix parasitica NIES-267]